MGPALNRFEEEAWLAKSVFPLPYHIFVWVDELSRTTLKHAGTKVASENKRCTPTLEGPVAEHIWELYLAKTRASGRAAGQAAERTGRKVGRQEGGRGEGGAGGQAGGRANGRPFAMGKGQTERRETHQGWLPP